MCCSAQRLGPHTKACRVRNFEVELPVLRKLSLSLPNQLQKVRNPMQKGVNLWDAKKSLSTLCIILLVAVA